MVNHDWRISNTLWWINMNYDHDELWWWWVLHRKHMGSEVVSSSIGLEIISFDIQGYDFRTPPLPDSHWLFNICLGHHKPRSNMIEGFWRIIINIDELWWWWWWWWWWVHARKYKGSEMVSSSKGLDVPSFHIGGYDFWTWFLISHHKPWWTMIEGSATHYDELIWTMIMMNSDDDGSFTESIWVLKWYPQALGWKLFPSISRVMILEPPPSLIHIDFLISV